MSGWLAGLVWLVPLPPLGAAVGMLLARSPSRRATAWLATGAVGASLALALAVFAGVAAGAGAAPGFVWGVMGGRVVPIAFLADRLSAAMALLVAGVALVVFVYAAAYIGEDGGHRRFFVELTLFVGGMLLLVLAGNLLVLYAAWELVGVSSFLLIGFYRDRPAAGRAAVKAFLVTRIGDLGLLVGVLLLYLALGDFGIARVAAAAAAGELGGSLPTVAALLLFLGAAGKSAQVPLHVWLPDAMEGPTPVSALIHSATMVAAGVFLVARLYPLFLAAAPALVVVATVGALTALLGAASAAAQRDLKRVLAYSTISQLGEMMAALGAGALGAGLFHLAGQALFKAGLFLAAGSVGHALGTTELAAMGGLRRTMPRTSLAFAIGALSLAAVPPFVGFWSGEAVLAALWRAFPPLFAVVLLAVGLAGFYVTRAGLLAFAGAPRTDRPVRESPAHLWAPALLMGGLAALAGLLDAPPAGHPLSGFLGVEPEPASLAVSVLGPVASLLGIGIAVLAHGTLGQPEGAKRRGLPPVASLRLAGWASAGFGFDRLYDATVVPAVRSLAARLAAAERSVVDAVPRAAAAGVVVASDRLRAFDAAVLDRAANDAASAGDSLVRGIGRWDARRLDRAVGEFALAWRAASGRLGLTQTGRVYHHLLAVAVWGAGTLVLILLAGLRG